MLHGNRQIIDRLYSVGISNCCICEMTIAELFYGAVKGGNPKNFEDIEVVRGLLTEKSVAPCFREYAEARIALKQKGMSLDLMDVFIASVALHHDYILVTHNVNHFSRIPNLTINDWQA